MMNRLSMNKVFHHVDHLRNIKNGDFPFPIHFVVGLSSRCNHCCQWCSVYGYKGDENTDIDPDALIEALTDGKALGLKAVTYIGQGEPLLYRHFDRLTSEVARLGIEQACFTNGGLLDTHFDTILKHFLWFRVSLDAGNQEQHNILHGVKNEFKKIIGTLEKMIQARGKNPFPTIGIQYGLHQKSADQLFMAAQIVRDIGVDYFAIKPIYNRGKVGIGIKRNVLKIKDIKEEVDKTLALAGDGFDVYYKPYQFKLMDNPDLFTRNYKKCYGPHFEWHIFENGDIAICGPMRSRIGNIYRSTLEELWRSDRYKAVLSTIDIEKCYKGCRVHALNEILWDLENPNRQNHINFI